jgi:hypothetical protein
MLPILCLDFDGVCHSYTSRWKGATTTSDEPVAGLFEFILAMSKHFQICIYSSRSHQEGGRLAMVNWFRKWAPYRGPCRYSEACVTWEFEHGISLSFPLEKPSAFVTIDDRALTFTGIWPSIDTLINFKPWNR